MFIKKIGKNYAINSECIDSIYTRKDETDEGTKYALVAEIYLAEIEGCEPHYHAERLGYYDTQEAADKAFNDLLEQLNG